MDVLEACRAKARAARRTLVLPEGEDPRIAEAAARVASAGLAEVLVLGADVPGCMRIDPATHPDREAMATALVARRARLTPAMAGRLLAKPLYFAGALVAAGAAHGMVAGAAVPTRRVIEAATMTIGLAEGVATPSSYFLMALPERTLVFADCALNVAPDAAALADIAVASGRTAEALLGEARVAMLSFSTLGSGTGAEAERVQDALTRARAAAPDLAIDGEFQVDTALNTVIAARKGATGPVAGQANVLIFPTLDAGNIGYKLVQAFAGAQAIGPFLQGFARPVSDLSRGASVDDIVAACAVTCAVG